jgi:hypothetical protein
LLKRQPAQTALFPSIFLTVFPFVFAARISLLEALTGCSLHLKYLDGQPLHVQVTIAPSCVHFSRQNTA